MTILAPLVRARKGHYREVFSDALRQGFTVERINAIAGFDPWFLDRLAEIVAAEEEVRLEGLPREAAGMRRLKAMGFSDTRLAQLALRSAHVEREMSEAVAAGGSGTVHSAIRAMTGGVTEAEVRDHRLRLGVRPVFKRIPVVVRSKLGCTVARL